MGRRVYSPTFVGRLEELQVLEAAMVRAANREPAVVLLGGEAGVGKTRLVAELAERCTADGMRVLAGGCVPVGDGTLPYAPIVEALRALVADLGAAVVRELVGSPWPELARLLPALGERQATGSPNQTTQAPLFEGVLALLGRLGDQAPVLLVVEDLHWADRSTRQLSTFLVRNLRRERIMVIVTYRSDQPGSEPLGTYLAELDRGGPVERMELPRFQRSEVVAQLTGILDAAPAADLVDAIFVRSEGNPFFTEELLAAVRAGSGELPATLRDLLRGRVEALPEPAQHMLRVAAVAGRRVPHRLLAAVAALDEQEQTEALRTAVAHRLLVTRPGEDSYEFHHGLLQEVVYADLLPSERAGLHAAYARALSDRSELAAGPSAVAVAELAAHWQGELRGSPRAPGAGEARKPLGGRTHRATARPRRPCHLAGTPRRRPRVPGRGGPVVRHPEDQQRPGRWPALVGDRHLLRARSAAGGRLRRAGPRSPLSSRRRPGPATGGAADRQDPRDDRRARDLRAIRVGSPLRGRWQGRVLPARGTTRPGAVADGGHALGGASAALSGRLCPLPRGRGIAHTARTTTPHRADDPGGPPDRRPTRSGAAAARDRTAGPPRPAAAHGTNRLDPSIRCHTPPQPPHWGSPAASLRSCACSPTGAPTVRSARSCSSLPRPPASTSPESSPSWASPAAARRPRSPTASTSCRTATDATQHAQLLSNTAVIRPTSLTRKALIGWDLTPAA